MMRPDLFQDRKCVHIKLDKGIHAGLRTKMFECGLTMQDVFEEFARLITIDDPAAIKALERLVKQKIQTEIDNVPKRRPRRKLPPVGEHDHDALYDMISGEGPDPNPQGTKKGQDEAA